MPAAQPTSRPIIVTLPNGEVVARRALGRVVSQRLPWCVARLVRLEEVAVTVGGG